MDVDGKTVARLNIEKIKKVANENGFYIIETNIININSKEANEIYNRQWKVKESFRSLKSAIETRPICVYKDEHIQSHVFLCFLSLIVLKYCIYKLKKFYKDNAEIQKLTMNMFIDALKLITITTKTVNGKVVIEIKNNLDPEYKELNKIYIVIFNMPLMVYHCNLKARKRIRLIYRCIRFFLHYNLETQDKK
ncbi:Mobile element protein [Mycoplasmopsis synoviae]|nr:Mobile element protein [Mycoplasmopsis synoviae]AQU47858.1 Mobile element protein [Mycoplasmopsis synoviae]